MINSGKIYCLRVMYQYYFPESNFSKCGMYTFVAPLNEFMWCMDKHFIIHFIFNFICFPSTIFREYGTSCLLFNNHIHLFFNLSLLKKCVFFKESYVNNNTNGTQMLTTIKWFSNDCYSLMRTILKTLMVIFNKYLLNDN